MYPHFVNLLACPFDQLNGYEISKTYAGNSPIYLEKFFLRLCVKIFQKYSLINSGYDQLFCFGYHIRAQKI